MLTPEILLTVKLNQDLFTDARRIALLKSIQITGSLSQAAKSIGISYKTAWDAIGEINRLSPHPFLITSTGGKHGGGSQLTPYAIRFIQLYDLLTQLQYNAFNILSDDKVPLDDILAATAKLSLQTSARNQLYGTVKQIDMDKLVGSMIVTLDDNVTELAVYITKPSIERLKLSAQKTVILLIKAPLIEFHQKGGDQSINYLDAKIQKIRQDSEWYDISVELSSGIVLHASKPSHNVNQLNLSEGRQVTLSIHPEHILVATLV